MILIVYTTVCILISQKYSNIWQNSGKLKLLNALKGIKYLHAIKN